MFGWDDHRFDQLADDDRWLVQIIKILIISSTTIGRFDHGLDHGFDEGWNCIYAVSMGIVTAARGANALSN